MELSNTEIKIVVKNMAREMVRRRIVKNADEIVEMNGKKYRCTREPRGESDFGSWEFLHNGTWHEVLNYQIRADLNRKAGKWKNATARNAVYFVEYVKGGLNKQKDFNTYEEAEQWAKSAGLKRVRYPEEENEYWIVQQ